MKKVTVIGSGSWGTALAVMLAENGHEVFIWSRRQDAVDELLKERTNKKYLPGVVIPDAIQATTDRKEAVDGADIVILAVPSRAVAQTVRDFAPYLKTWQILVNVAKGLEPETLFLLSDVIKREAPQCEVCVLSGPSHAEEVARKVPTACLIACENEAVAKLVQEEFANPRFRLYTNGNRRSTEKCYGTGGRDVRWAWLWGQHQGGAHDKRHGRNEASWHGNGR